MRKQSIVNRWSALDAANDYLIKVTPGINPAIRVCCPPAEQSADITTAYNGEAGPVLPERVFESE